MKKTIAGKTVEEMDKMIDKIYPMLEDLYVAGDDHMTHGEAMDIAFTRLKPKTIAEAYIMGTIVVKAIDLIHDDAHKDDHRHHEHNLVIKVGGKEISIDGKDLVKVIDEKEKDLKN